MCKEIQTNNVIHSALIDTGSDVNLIRENVVETVGIETFNDIKIKLIGLGGKEIMTNKSIKAETIIDNESYCIDYRVVSKESMKYRVVTGSEFLSKIDLVINKEGIKITKVKNEEEACIFNINVSSDELDLNYILNLQHRKEIQKMVEGYKPEKSKTIDMKMKIVITDKKPIYNMPRRLPYTERDAVDKQVKSWLEEGIVEPSLSEYASQVVIVRKKDGSPRVCIDFRKLNKVVVKDRYPIPNLEDQIDGLRDAVVFSAIDLKNGFFHADVGEESKKYTSFVTHQGQFQFKKVPFGFCNSPAHFQRYINTIFRDLQNEKIVLIYMDDIIILAKDEEQAIMRLKMVFQRAREYGLVINFKKSQFLVRRIEYLGYIIENNKIFPSKDKIAAAINFPEPTSVKDVQSFLGLAGYFRKFIQDYSLLAKPLSDLIKKDKQFQFERDEKECFKKLKEKLASKPVLNIYRKGAETEVHTDASKFGFGGILLQRSLEDGKLHPVYYYSKKTTNAEQKFTSYELEVLAVVRALQKFRIYLIGQSFKVKTDCIAFKQTMDKKDIVPRVARWILALSEFDFNTEHQSGNKMKHVDALSRSVIMLNEDSISYRIKQAQMKDKHLKVITEILKQKEYNDYFLKDDVIYKFNKGMELIVVPTEMEEEIIKAAHNKGHFGVLRTAEVVQQEFFIDHLKGKVEKIIKNCIRCILNNRKAGKQEGFLHPREKNNEPFYTYHIDHMGPLESTNKNYKYILVIIDDFTKFVWIYPTKSTTTKEVINKLEQQKKIFGNPYQIISDRGTAFTSDEFEEYCRDENIAHHRITTGLPRANGQVERINSVIIAVLSKLSAEDPTKWFQYIDAVQRMLNSTYHRSINTTPFELMVGNKMRNKNDLRVMEAIQNEFTKKFVDNREKLREEAKECIKKIQQENCKYYNRRRNTSSHYKVGDLVAIKRTQLGPGMKLRPKYIGPYKIIKNKGNDTYDVEKVGEHEGPRQTSTCAEFLKTWMKTSALESNDCQNGRLWEAK